MIQLAQAAQNNTPVGSASTSPGAVSGLKLRIRRDACKERIVYRKYLRRLLIQAGESNTQANEIAQEATE